jgi:xanthine dehydrogenase YagS FAD-binding subunit
MKAFEYSSAGSVDEIVEVLRQATHDGAVRPLAGGTDLLPLMKEDITAPARLVDIKRAAGLNGDVRETADGLTLGALTTLADIETHPLLRERYPALTEAATVAATPQLRNMATLGGNLLQRPRCWYFRNQLFHCWLKGGEECPARDGENRLHALFGGGPCYAVHPSDLATALVALDASVRLRGGEGERTVTLADFFALPTDDRRVEVTMRPDEVLLDVRIPTPAPGMRSHYLKAMDRKVWAFALVGVAAAVRLDGGLIADARLVLGGVAPIPWRLPVVERLLVGAKPEPALFDQAAEAALADAQPLQDNAYKVPLARALLRRSLSTLVDGASGVSH